MKNETKVQAIKVVIHDKDDAVSFEKVKSVGHNSKTHWFIKACIAIGIVSISVLLLELHSYSVISSLTNQRTLKFGNLNINPEDLQKVLKETQQTMGKDGKQAKFDLGKLFSQMRGFQTRGRTPTHKDIDKGIKRRMQVFNQEYKKIFGTNKLNKVEKDKLFKKRKYRPLPKAE